MTIHNTYNRYGTVEIEMSRTEIRILKLLKEDGALDPKGISIKLGIKVNTVRPTLSNMRRLGGLVKHFKEIPGVYEITDKGIEYLKEQKTTS